MGRPEFRPGSDGTLYAQTTQETDMNIWPLAPLGVDPGVGASFMVIFAISLIFLLTVFLGLLVRLTRERREFWTVHCPDGGGRALVVIRRAAEGPESDAVTECSRWHGRRPHGCDRRCVLVA